METVLCSSPNIDIHQEVAFETAKSDERIFKHEQICLLCTYVSPDGMFFEIGKVNLAFNVNRKSDKRVCVLLFRFLSNQGMFPMYSIFILVVQVGKCI